MSHSRIGLMVVCTSSPREDVARLRLPQSIEDAKDLGTLLSKYKETHYSAVVGAVVVTYVLYPFALSPPPPTSPPPHSYPRALYPVSLGMR